MAYTIHTLGTPNGTTTRRLLQIWEGAVRATHHFLTEEAIVALRPTVGQALAAVPVDALVDEEGRIVAFIGVANGKIEMLFVDAQQRGRGLGRLLVHHAVANRHAAAVDVNEQNPAAHGFYERMGFVVTGRDELDAQGNPYPILHMRRTRPL